MIPSLRLAAALAAFAFLGRTRAGPERQLRRPETRRRSARLDRDPDRQRPGEVGGRRRRFRPQQTNVLRQSGEATFPICYQNGTKLQDGFVEVKFKALSGKEDQAGGVIWRCQDTDNYYVARANALEDNVTIYHTLQGKRVSFKNVNLKVTPLVWHTLRVTFKGNHFTVSFDGKVVIEATDDSLSAPGLTGVWTKADSVTQFDDFACGKD